MTAPVPDAGDPAVVSVFDELPLWSAPFGLRLLETVRLGAGLTVVDVGFGTGFPLLERRLNELASRRGELRLDVPFACLDCRATGGGNPTRGGR